ncbi:ATP-binding protein [Sphingomonas sp. AOB5]|uniref:sensor histidine kinase n=1 Tax=Sphingomonas sp. AOB5 TaxID=3034017 RepID=UPI0023F7A20F|nr:ATP-binding protein [Sphingomonas sp. AOB5]MDF7775417.1 ATP-binding protein [Sphingomonas sp. AOB5]
MKAGVTAGWIGRIRGDAGLWAAAALIFVAVQLLFWLMVGWGETAVRPASLTARPWVEYQSLDEAGKPVGAPARAAYDIDPIYNAPIGRGSPRAAFLIPFDLAQPQDDLAFFLASTQGLEEIEVNGHLLQPNVPLNALRGASDGEAVFYMLPKGALKAGRNQIRVLVETQSAIIALAPFSIGPAEEAARAVKAAELVGKTLPTVAVSFLLFAILLCMVVNWPAEDRPRVRALLALLALWMARTYFITFQTPFEIPFLFTYFIYYLLETSALMAFGRYVVIEGQLDPRWRRGIGWLWIALIAGTVIATGLGLAMGPSAQHLMKRLPQAVGIASLLVGVGSLLVLARSAAQSADGRLIERGALMLCMTAFLVDAADSAFGLTVPFATGLPLTFYIAAPAGILLGLGVIMSAAREATEARRTVMTANRVLAERLAQREAELDRTHETQQQMLRRQVMLEERQRIVRDMHDGIGGQLLGLMMQVRGGAIAGPQIEAGLQSSIADLRLIVDSMDTAEESLVETLRSLEHRVRPQIEAAGMAFHFFDEAQDGIAPPGPRATLQILRILQEAVTNAVRHSGASEIRLETASDADELRISVADNGKGIGAAVRRGRGLKSMETRAGAVGGRLAVESGPGGTRVSLILPREAIAANGE